MDEQLGVIVEEIGKLSDRAEASRWDVAQAIAAAYCELPLYTRGLTAGLCTRLKKSTDMIYQLRDAYNLRERLRYNAASLSVSHFSALSKLADRYDLDDDTCREWLDWIKETSSSVRGMSIEISIAHTQNQRKAYFDRAEKVGRQVETLWQDAEGLDMPDPLRAETKDVLTGLRAWIDNLEKWKSAADKTTGQD